MNLFTWENWPVLVICVGMIAAAVIDWWKFKVPNKLTFPLIISGWVLGPAQQLRPGARRRPGRHRRGPARHAGGLCAC